jgi:hypothetical protein
MPIRFLVQPRDRVVRVTYMGNITLRDLAAHIRRLVEAGLLHRPRLVDSRAATIAASPEDIRIFSSLMSTLHARHGRAPVAFVPGHQSWLQGADVFRELGAAASPHFAILPDIEAAETWLGAEATSPAEPPVTPAARPRTCAC